MKKKNNDVHEKYFGLYWFDFILLFFIYFNFFLMYYLKPFFDMNGSLVELLETLVSNSHDLGSTPVGYTSPFLWYFLFIFAIYFCIFFRFVAFNLKLI